MANFSQASETNPLKIKDRFGQTGLGFSAWAELHPGLKKSHVIETGFQPRLKSRKQYGCR